MFVLAAGLLAASLLARPAVAQHDMPFSTVEALVVSDPLQVDGRLDEEAWSRAQVASGFTQREKPEEPATEPTEFLVVYTPTMLYIGFRCFDSEPDQIVAKELERDGRLFRDDAVIVVIDTFHDHRNSYFLEVNPAGAILDALSSEEGRSLNSDWDGVWTAAARITPEGWTAEMAIPFSTL
ncbi:MAG TPA: carbohydrate binding family 9 domain-containing protein, partial [Thermoanaerobaculia bacterium]|nr:carbohydrate binding family 9 domain-containing protein [Thermoanaerobaculia bacterium]